MVCCRCWWLADRGLSLVGVASAVSITVQVLLLFAFCWLSSVDSFLFSPNLNFVYFLFVTAGRRAF
jgi:hypothetical protein